MSTNREMKISRRLSSSIRVYLHGKGKQYSLLFSSLWQNIYWSKLTEEFLLAHGWRYILPWWGRYGGESSSHLCQWVWGWGTGVINGLGYNSQGILPSNPLSPTRPHFQKVPQLPQTALPDGEQLFKHRSPWGT